MIKNALEFIILLIKKIKDNELVEMANALSFKLILAAFPFAIFLLSTLSFLKVDYSYVIKLFFEYTPEQANGIINTFLREVIYEKKLSVLSSSLAIALFSASSGFYSALKGLNRAFELKDKRSWLKTRFVCIIMVFIFTILIVLSLAALIFGDTVVNFFLGRDVPRGFTGIVSQTNIAMVLLLFLLISIVYIIAVNRRLSLGDVAPGSIFTVVFWFIVSKLFNIYVKYFSSVSVIYGSIGGVFVLFYWIYLISVIFLIGGQINAIFLLKERGEIK